MYMMSDQGLADCNIDNELDIENCMLSHSNDTI